MFRFFLVLTFVYALTAKAENVLIVGDSLSCGPFGTALLQSFKNHHDHATLYCTVSSAPSHWVNGRNPPGQQCFIRNSDQPQSQGQLCGGNGRIPALASIIQNTPHTRAVIALGTNSLGSSTVDPTYARMARMMAQSSRGCDWIGPPRLNPAQARGFNANTLTQMDGRLPNFYRSLRNSVNADCSLIDSRAATAPGTPGNNTGDGVHRTASAGQYWMQNISGNLFSSSANRNQNNSIGGGQ